MDLCIRTRFSLLLESWISDLECQLFGVRHKVCIRFADSTRNTADLIRRSIDQRIVQASNWGNPVQYADREWIVTTPSSV